MIKQVAMPKRQDECKHTFPLVEPWHFLNHMQKILNQVVGVRGKTLNDKNVEQVRKNILRRKDKT
eukprot:GDKH01003112.1.p3 GENE.GDKH01003112.1~~GDKH01003112.1.p3  ORF type:complete len:65 (+),score=6.96 GDKH01003112.1:432-626(+)